jgi:hypothetical protein
LKEVCKGGEFEVGGSLDLQGRKSRFCGLEGGFVELEDSGFAGKEKIDFFGFVELEDSGFAGDKIVFF